jgi:monomeric isocitrate dehydrogenase
MAEFILKSGVKTLDIKDEDKNIIKSFEINVGEVKQLKTWMKELKGVESIMADIKDMPKTIYELVKNKAYKRISSEIYWNLKDASGQVYKRALKAIALLGGDTPAVGSLALRYESG